FIWGIDRQFPFSSPSRRAAAQSASIKAVIRLSSSASRRIGFGWADVLQVMPPSGRSKLESRSMMRSLERPAYLACTAISLFVAPCLSMQTMAAERSWIPLAALATAETLLPLPGMPVVSVDTRSSSVSSSMVEVLDGLFGAGREGGSHHGRAP